MITASVMKGLRISSMWSNPQMSTKNGMVEKKVNALKLILQLDLKQLVKDN